MSKSPAPPVTLDCKYDPCGKAFTIPPWEVSRRGRERRFCSIECADRFRRKPIPTATTEFNRLPAPVDLDRACECGVVFQLPSPKSNQRFCSQPCRAKAQTTTPKPQHRPMPTLPKQIDWPELESSGTVRCHRCEQPRPRGVACARCERWDCDGQPREVAS